MVGTGSIPRVALVPWLVAGLVATFACGSSKSQTSVSDDTQGGESALGGTDGGGSGGASAKAGQGGDAAKGGTGGTLTVGGGGGRPGSGGTGAGAGPQAGMSGSGVSGGTGGTGTGGTGDDGGSADGPASGAAGRGGSAGMGGAPAVPTLEGCATWTLETARNATSTIALTDGGVLLFRPGDASNTQTVYNTSDVAISQAGLTGDFDVLVEFDHFEPGDAHPFWGPALEAGVWFHDTDGRVYQANGSVGAGDGRLVVSVPDDDTPIHGFDPIPDTLVDAAGSIEIARNAGIFTVTVVINGVTNTISSSVPYDAEPLVLFIGIGLMGQSDGPADSSVRVTSVTVDGGGSTVQSDAFDCSP
jgi:hypothetical protein